MCGRIALERKVDRMLNIVEWINPESDIYDGSHIAFRMGEIVIRGMVSLAPRMVEVTMESPHTGFTGIETIDADMPVIFTEHPYEISPASLAGKDRDRRRCIRKKRRKSFRRLLPGKSLRNASGR